MRAPGREPFVAEGRRSRLTVRRVSSDVLLVENDRHDGGAPSLTRREWEVMRLVAQGSSNAEIARELWVAPSTVRKHLENVYGKLGVTSRTAALARLRPHVLP